MEKPRSEKVQVLETEKLRLADLVADKQSLVATKQLSCGVTSDSEAAVGRRVARRVPLPASVKRAVFQRDQHCRWKEPNSNQFCGSRFQLQIDHKQSVWAGGDNSFENLQLLCSRHNHLKYELESRLGEQLESLTEQ
jgi:5-methylcytosine-specific restriction endonuclease McrA